MARDALDNKDLRSDPYQEFVFHAIDYVYRHRMWFGAAAAVAVIVAGSVTGLVLYQAAQATRMAAQYNVSENLVYNMKLPAEERIRDAREGFRKFVSEHHSAELVPFAWIHLAALALQDDDPEQAEEAYINAAGHDKATSLIRVIAQTALAKIRENRGQFGQSGKIYRELPADAFGDLKALSLGRIAVAEHQDEEARRHLETLQAEYPDSILAPLARKALSYYP